MTFDLRLGSCLDAATGMPSLAAKSVDCAISDPPYSEHVHRHGKMTPAKGRERKGLVLADRDFAFPPITQPDRLVLAAEHARLVRRWTLVFCDVESAHLWRDALEAAGLSYIRTCFWHKTVCQPQLTGDRPASAIEAIVCAHAPGGGRLRWNNGGQGNVFACPVESGPGRFNEAQKPVPLLDALTLAFTDPGETILDSHAGSATGGVAAIRNGRHWIGWEAREGMHAKALARLEGTDEQWVLFPRGKARQGKMFAVNGDS